MRIDTTPNQAHSINGNGTKRHDLLLTAGVDVSRLIGIPHLFGRYIDTRNGFLIDPIGLLTLQPDGRITGYSHPNEDHWRLYDHGETSREQSFNFFVRDNSWIPSSTWTQRLGDMPIGHFCNESEGIKRLCLLPHKKAGEETSVVYLMASCLKFYKDGRTLPRLFKQLFAEGIEPGRIRVVVNGCKKNEDKEIDGISYAFSTHNAWEWSALYEAPLRWQDFDYGMLLHDTNDVLPGFRRKVEEFNNHLPWDHLPATPNAACLIGLYSFDFLKRQNTWLNSIDGIDKRNGVIAEVAGELLLRARTALVIGDPQRFGGSRYAEWGPHIDQYDTGSPRHVRDFPSVNLRKYIHSGGQPSNPEDL